MRWLPLAALVTLVGGQAWADVPRLLNFQGRLTDGLGSTLQGQYSVTFTIYDAASGGTSCHGAAQTVYVNAGLFNANINVTGTCNFAVPYFLGIKVGTDPEMSPRLPLAAAPYSLTAGALVTGNNVYPVGHAANNIPWVDGTGQVNTNLNADLLRGMDSSAFSPATHYHRGSAIYQCYRQFSNGTWAYFLTNVSGTNCSAIGYFAN
ncbi:MAG TPA: hypothetical protein VGQ83_17510 [Polyangia bacterium]|jgi:hypothetical protein